MECRVCHRNHTEDQPCPLRVANLLTGQEGSYKAITTPDAVWLEAHPEFSILDTIEDTLADLM